MIKDIPSLIEAITSEIRSRTDVAVVGLSGGADSTLVSCLCTKALGKENVYGIHMPYGDTDYKTFNSRSVSLSSKLGIHSLFIPIYKIADNIDSLVEEELWENGLLMDADGFRNLNTTNRGNSRSRARMCVLYSVCHEIGDKTLKRARVIGTGNLSEDFIGYDTKGGDALADFFPIGELFKSEVYQLLDHFKAEGLILEDMIDRHPSAGLWEGQTDEGELGYSYNTMEPAIKLLTRKENTPVEITEDFAKVVDFVKQRHLGNKHKHEAPPAFALRKFCT